MAKNLKYFRKLKTLMFDQEVDQTYIAEKAGKSIGYISNRFQGKLPFSMDDVYTIIEILEIPQEEALTYFPKGGISEKKGAKTV